jgi:hypothetical protein
LRVGVTFSMKPGPIALMRSLNRPGGFSVARIAAAIAPAELPATLSILYPSGRFRP